MKSYKEIFKKKQILPYIMIGDGGFHKSHELLDLYIENGAEIVELGIPFSDPSADGPIIQGAAQRSLDNGYTIKKCIDFIYKSKSKYPNLKFIIMTYLNPILNYGIEQFIIDSKPDGLIIPDLPFEEYELILPYAKKHDVNIIPLITIDTDINRIKSILDVSSGFIYMISLKGTTGNKSANLASTKNLVNEIRALTDLPLVAGFGIKTKQQVTEFLKFYDGVIIASELIKLHQLGHNHKVVDLLKSKKAVI